MPVFAKVISCRHLQCTIYQCGLILFIGVCCISVLSCNTYMHPPMDHMNHGNSDNPQNMQPMDATSIQKTEKKDPLLYSDRQHAATRFTEDGIYRVSLFSNEFPLPLQKIHAWTVHLEASDSQNLDNVKVTVHGGMPEHQHDFPTRVKVTENLGNGGYRVDGVKFSMPGYWQIRFNIKENNRRDTVVFDVML